MLNPKEIEKLLHDLKRAMKVVSLVRDEDKKKKRHLIADLLVDELDRLYADLEELKESGD